MDKVFNGRLIFVLVVTLLCLYSVYPTAYYFSYIASMGSDPTVEQVEKRQQLIESGGMINLGLDLQGGVDLLIEVQTEELIQTQLGIYADDIRTEFRKENVASVVTVDKTTETITVKVENYEDKNIAQDILNISIDAGYLEADDLTKLDGGVVTLRMPEVTMSRLKNDSVDAALKTIRKRVDAYGLTQPEVVRQPPNRIRVRIPGETNPDRIIQNLLTIAVLEFRMVHPENTTQVTNLNLIEPGSFVSEAGTGLIRKDFLVEVPSRLKVGAVEYKLADEIPGIPAGYEVMLGQHTTTSATGELEVIDNLVYLVRDRAFITGKELLQASPYTNLQSLNPNERHTVNMSFNSEGTESLADTSIDNENRQFAIILDRKVISAPVFREKILYGSASISGGFTLQEATDLALTLRGGSLPAPLKVVSQKSVGATLGADSVADSVVALGIGCVFLILLLLFAYKVAGVVAILAMILNVLLILAIMALMGATLTLSGIGGILLTMGMAVDANVLIYERLREELALKKPIRAAITTSFERAFSVIMDGNITSLLPALALILFEIVEGSVKGFWLALAIGLIVNLYTGITVTRALVDSYLAKTGTFGIGSWAPFLNSKFDFMRVRMFCYVGSGIIIGVASVYLLVNGINPGVDFTGGVSASVRADVSSVSRDQLKLALESEFKDVRVVRVLNESYYSVTVTAPEGMAAQKISDDLKSILSTNFGDKATVESVETVDALIGSEFLQTAIITIIITCLIILGYLGVRFNFAFGLGAVVALIHDVVFALGIFVLLGHSVTMDIVSALLIILGYSVNDTIVTFDRIRELMKEHYGMPIGQVINRAINETLTRTFFTSSTTLSAILAMYLFGGISLKDFAFVLFVGIGVGTYSSIFIASAIVYDMLTRAEAKHGVEAVRGQRKKVRISA
ncbi:MAG: protein translocase subunit SecD [Candidatus Sumerlaeia bacterium]|nr:protein translocase subunit SecD [Candidatus Sumerlaeia bacterium]